MSWGFHIQICIWEARQQGSAAGLLQDEREKNIGLAPIILQHLARKNCMHIRTMTALQQVQALLGFSLKPGAITESIAALACYKRRSHP